MDRMSDTRSLGSGRSRGKQRLPLPSQQGAGLLGKEMDLLSQFSDSQPSKSSKTSKRTMPLPSSMGDNLETDLLSSLVSSGEYVDARSNPSKRSSNRKKLPLPSEGLNGAQSLLGEFLDPPTTQNASKNSLAPAFSSSSSHARKKHGASSLLDENGQNDFLERLSSLSSKSAGSNSKRSVGSKNASRKVLPRPSDMASGKDDLLSMFAPQGETDDSLVADTYETIVYDPEEDTTEQEAAGLSPRDVIKEASDVLSLLSGHEGGIKPSVLTSRTKYSDEDSKSVSSQGSRERPASSKVSGTGYISDVSRVSSRAAGVTASLTSSMGEGRQWNQNRAYFLRTAKLREKNKDSPLNKFLPGGSMSSTRQGGTSMDEQHSMPEANSADTELIEQLQLELEEARRTIRSHETKILVLQDEVEAARESCMEEECERVEAEIAKDRVRNENRMLKVQIQQLESNQSSKDSSESTPSEFPSRNWRPKSALEPTLSSIAIQTDELRNVKSMGDVARQIKLTHSLEQLQEGEIDDVLSEVEEADGLVIPVSNSGTMAIPFREKSVSYKVSIIQQLVQSLVLRQSDFSGSLYRENG